MPVQKSSWMILGSMVILVCAIAFVILRALGVDEVRDTGIWWIVALFGMIASPNTQPQRPMSLWSARFWKHLGRAALWVLAVVTAHMWVPGPIEAWRLTTGFGVYAGLMGLIFVIIAMAAKPDVDDPRLQPADLRVGAVRVGVIAACCIVFVLIGDDFWVSLLKASLFAAAALSLPVFRAGDDLSWIAGYDWVQRANLWVMSAIVWAALIFAAAANPAMTERQLALAWAIGLMFGAISVGVTTRKAPDVASRP